ncbi:isoprenoid synthase domain-containing protein [Mycena epipterygia]|nr:isoprenoid synthase domain-containing protein [Mycena epipterygia]
MSQILPSLAKFPPARQHPRSDELIVETHAYFMKSWPLAVGLCADYAAFGTKTIPDASYDKILWACKAYMLLFILDDRIEREVRRSVILYVPEVTVSQEKQTLASRVKGLIRGDINPGESQVDMVMNTIFRGIEAGCTGQQYSQFSRLTIQYLKAQNPQPYTDIQTYLDFRRMNAGGYLVLSLSRYALDIHLTDEELNERSLVASETVALDLCVLCNDVASYEKEMRAGAANVNLVTFLLKHGVEERRFASASAVKEYVCQIITDLEGKLHNCLGVALKNSTGQKEDYRRWLKALPCIVSGNTWWSQLVSFMQILLKYDASSHHVIKTTRYNIPGHAVPRTIIHLECTGDIVEPEP